MCNVNSYYQNIERLLAAGEKAMKQIIVAAAETQEIFEASGPKFEETHCQSIKEAKNRAKYLLTVEYQNVIEASQPLGYSQVLVNGECLYDFFGKGH
jgi:hypothetical protein